MSDMEIQQAERTFRASGDRQDYLRWRGALERAGLLVSAELTSDWRSCLSEFLLGARDTYGDDEDLCEKHDHTRPDPIVPGTTASLDPFDDFDIVEVVVEAGQDGDYGKWDGVGIFRLRDGRFLKLEGGCDTSGWH